MGELLEELRACYAKKNRQAGMNCIEKVIKTSGDECTPHFLLFTQDDCPFCEEEKGNQKSRIESGIVKEVNIDTEEGKRMGKKFDISETPVLVLVDCDDKEIDFSQEDGV